MLFVYGDAVLNEDFQRALRELISRVCPEVAESLPVQIVDLPDDRPRRMIILEEEE
jgi:hypothetical protein